MNSAAASDATPDQLLRAQALLDAYPIEVVELRASPKQIRFQQAFFDRVNPETGTPADIFVALGGNRSGKSIVGGCLCFAKYIRDRARNGDWFWCVGQTLDRSIGGQQKELWNALPRWMFGDQTWAEKIGFGAHRKIVLPTSDGGRCLVEFRSADQDPSTFEQAKLTGVWCDERLPESIYNRLLPRIIDRNGWILYTDIPEQFWQMERLANATPEAGVFFQHFEMYDNEHNLPAGAIVKAAARMTTDEQSMRIRGLFQLMEGIVFREFVDTTDGNLIRPFKIPDYWPKWRLIDYGASAPTACLWVTISDNETAYAYREYYQAGLSVQKNAEAILAMSEGDVLDDGKGPPLRGTAAYRTTLMDPHAVDPPPIFYGAAKTIAQQYEEAGIPSTGWPFVNVMGEHALVQRVKFRFERRTFRVFDTLTNFRREAKSWKHKLDKDGKPLAADAYENKNNHLLDCAKGFFGTNPCFTSPKGRVVGGDRDGDAPANDLAA